MVAAPAPVRQVGVGDKSTPGSRCLALLGQLKRVTHEEVGAADAYLDRTKPVPEAKALFGHLMIVLEHTVGPKNLPLATMQASLIFQASPSLSRKKDPRRALPVCIQVPFAPLSRSKRVSYSIFVTSVFSSRDHILCPINTLLRLGAGVWICNSFLQSRLRGRSWHHLRTHAPF